MEIQNPDLKEIVYQVVTQGLAALGDTDIKGVGKGDPEDWADLPFIGINLTADGETAAHIGDSLDDEIVEEEGLVYAGTGTLWQATVEVTLWTTNKIARDRLGLLLKAALMLGRGTSANPGLFLTTPGVVLAKITGGHDQGVADLSGQFAPHALYSRTYYVVATLAANIQESAGPPVQEFLAFGESYSPDVFVGMEAGAPSL